MWLEQLRRRMGLHSRKSVSPRASKLKQSRSQLSVESLEERTVPAVIDVISTADNNSPVITAGHAGTAADPFLASSLRSAISFANTNAGGNTINLTVAGDYKITLTGTPGETDNAAGEFAILSAGGNLTIQNTSVGAVAVDGGNNNRVFDINPTFDPNNPTPKFLVTMTGFTIENGLATDVNNPDGPNASGGGIRDVGNASLTLNNVVVTNNTASADGGGVSFENTVSVPWTLTVNNSTISNNHAGDAGGGLETDGSGKIFVNAGTVITGNTTVNQGAGIWLDAIMVGNVFQGANLTVTGATISNNTAQIQVGGGIGNAGNGTVTIVDSTLEGNFAGMTGGGFGDQNAQGTLIVQNSLFLENSAIGNGGGIAAGGPTTTITNTELKNNSSSGSGGGVFANGVTLTVLNSTVVGNTAAGGGGGGFEIQTTGTGAAASFITNTTISGNSALNAGGGDIGGGIDFANNAAFPGTMTLLNDTINGNYAISGGGVAMAAGGIVNVQNTIIAGNHVTGSGPDYLNVNGTAFTDLGGNLIGIESAGLFHLATDKTGTGGAPLDPLLGPLQNNGGPTIGAPGTAMTLQTELLPSGSPAIDAGVAAGAPPTDERGFTRPDGGVGQPDIGAFEFENATLNVSVAPANPTTLIGNLVFFNITITNTGTSTLPLDNTTLNASLPAGLSLFPGTPLSFALGTLAPGQSVTFTIATIATAQGTQTVTATLTSIDTAHPITTTGSIAVTLPPPPPPVTPNPFANLTPQEKFVQALYLAELGRAGGVAELDGWVAILNGPGGVRAVIADIDESFEARDRIVQGWYLTFLGRMAQGGEEKGFVNLLATETQEQVLSVLLSSGEFYARAQTLISSGTPDQRYVQALYQLLLNRTGDSASVAADTAAVASQGRQAVAFIFLTSSEYRANQITADFNTLLHRSPDSGSLNSAVGAPIDLQNVRMDIEASQEFFNNG